MVTIDIAQQQTRDGRLLSLGDYRPVTSQAAWEWEQLLRLFDARQPRRILEIGCDLGGTLHGWLTHASVGSLLVAVDDRCIDAERWHDWARLRGSTLHVVKGDSRAAEIIAAAAEHAPYDWVFIDADHSYEFVSLDWANYGALAAPGGVVAFHDINERNGYGVHQLWREIQAQGYVTQEINAQLPSLCGVGVVYV